ncbi:MAG TPA: ATP-binding protein [Nocardioidaceae bacterium]|nr:ATP-binding protein [Nocardioidaceae bacterium]
MATVTLHVGPDAAHVRVVRLVAATFARRAGVAEESIDEIKLAVGEACGMAVSALGPDAEGRLSIELHDTVGVQVVVRTPVDLANQSAPDGGTGLVPDGLDVIRALLDQVDISTGPGESVVAMSWPGELGRAAM